MMKRPSLAVVFLTIFLDLLGFGIVMPFLAPMARDNFGASVGVATLLGGCYSLMQFFFVPLWGRISDRVGRRPVLLFSIFSTAASMAGLGLAVAYGQTVVWLFVMRMLTGMATANIGTAAAYIADITSKEDRVKGMGLIGMAFGLGFIFGPPVGGLTAPVLIGGREGPLACFIAAALSLINFILAVKILPESLPVEKRQGKEKNAPLFDLKGFKEAFSHLGIKAAVGVNFLIILGFSALEMTYTFFAKDLFSLSMTHVGYLFFLMGITAALVQGGFIRRVGNKYADTSLIFWGVVLQGVAFLGLAVSPGLGVWSLAVFSVVLAIGNGLTQPSISGYISRRCPPSSQGSYLGTNQSFASLARVFGPPLGGFSYQAFGPESPYILTFLMLFVSLFLIKILFKYPMVSD